MSPTLPGILPMSPPVLVPAAMFPRASSTTAPTVPFWCDHLSAFLSAAGYGRRWKSPLARRKALSSSSLLAAERRREAEGGSRPWSDSHSSHSSYWESVMK